MILLAIATATCAESGQSQTNRISVSGSVYQNENFDSGLTDCLLSELSRHSQLAVVERASLGLILNEQILQNIHGDVLKQVRLGRLIKADCLVWVSLYQTNGLVEVVKASTGRGMASWPFQYDRQPALAALTSQVPKMVDVICQKMTEPTTKSMTVAFVKPTWDAGNERWRSSVDQMIVSLASGLETNGIGILARQFSQDLIKEQWAYEKGFVLSDIAGQGLEGADCLIRINFDQDTQTLVVSLIEITTGRRIGQTTCHLSDLPSGITNQQVLDWLLTRFRVMTDRGPAPQGVSAKPQPIVELLSHFYQGILLHNEGRYIDAVEHFTDIKSKTGLIQEIDDWIVSSFRVAGMTEVADHWTERPLPPVYWSNRVPTNKPPDSGQTIVEQKDKSIAYLGITCESEQWSRWKSSLNILAMEALGQTGQQMVMASGDMSALRDEYDILVGLEQTQGTKWQSAPDMLFNDAITVHIVDQSGNPAVYMCRMRGRNPNKITEVQLPLPADINQWKATFSKGMKELVNADQKAKPWTPPPTVIGYSLNDLLNVLVTNYTDWNYIRAIILDPSQTVTMINRETYTRFKYGHNWEQHPSQILRTHEIDIVRWLLRILPENHPEKPWLEFLEASCDNPSVRLRWDNQNPVYKPEIFQRIAEKYPSHPVGLLARYNELVMNLRPSNMTVIQLKIAEVVERLDRMHSPDIRRSTMEAIHKVNHALQYSVGKTEQTPPDIFPYFNPVLLSDCEVAALNTGDACSIPQGYRSLAPVTKEQMQIDWDAIFEGPRINLITMRFVRSLVERYGRGTKAANYALFKYANIINPISTPTSTKENKDDVTFVKQTYSELMANELKLEQEANAPKMTNVMDIAILIETANSYREANSTNDFKQTKAQIIQDLIQGRIIFDPPHNPDKCSICRQGYKESCSRKQRAERQENQRNFVKLFSSDKPSEVDVLLRPIIEKEWGEGPLEDYVWRSYCEWLNFKRPIKEIAAFAYSPYLKRLHELYDDKPKTAEIVCLYMQFAIILYRIEQYDLACPLLEQIVQFKDEKGMPFDVGMHAMSLYLMSLLKVRDKNYPEALALAKETLKTVGNCADNDYWFLDRIDNIGKRGGFGPGVKPRTINLIDNLRTNSALEFVNPYEKKNKEVHW